MVKIARKSQENHEAKIPLEVFLLAKHQYYVITTFKI